LSAAGGKEQCGGDGQGDKFVHRSIYSCLRGMVATCGHPGRGKRWASREAPVDPASAAARTAAERSAIIEQSHDPVIHGSGKGNATNCRAPPQREVSAPSGN